ncbi:MAG: HesA/MoeB/ThiF family protein [Spirochaetota bacterium]
MPSTENQNEFERYTRQLAAEQWGEAEQGKLKLARVAVVGIGGLGSPVTLYLAAAGVGSLLLVDDDAVSLSNLNRQILFSEKDIGSNKAEQAARRISALNSELSVDFRTARVTDENCDELFSETDIIVDCLDNYTTRFAINRYAVRKRIPLVHAGIHGFNGQLTTILPGKTPCLECLFAGLEDPADKAGERLRSPAIGAVVGTIGSLQALEVLKMITGIGALYTERLMVFEGLNGAFDEIPVKRDKNCPVCSGI